MQLSIIFIYKITCCAEPSNGANESEGRTQCNSLFLSGASDNGDTRQQCHRQSTKQLVHKSHKSVREREREGGEGRGER